ncbi:hypothetical protein CEXT_754071 [Caerostris extrusa]|uniref:Uncharacterized protein n=1 Tax=Caerostris extrusa TaxID=172846 RepID=A0AAV4Q162_CAEEX|nr:hypothetical protein CEXT_754071 [Caerostris extrusa]
MCFSEQPGVRAESWTFVADKGECLCKFPSFRMENFREVCCAETQLPANQSEEGANMPAATQRKIRTFSRNVAVNDRLRFQTAITI